METSTITGGKKKVHMITKLEQLKTWLNFISSHAWPSLQVLITPIVIKSENVNFLYKFLALYLSTTGRTGLLFGNTVNCLLIDTANKRSPIALSSCRKTFLSWRRRGDTESKGGASEEHLWLLTMWPGLLFQRQCLHVVLSLLLVLAFATRGFSPATRIFPYPCIYFFFTDLPVDLYVCLSVECSIEGLERYNQNPSRILC